MPRKVAEEAAEEAAEDSVNVDNFTNRVANRFSEAALTKDNVGRTFLLRGDKCPAGEVLFGTSDEIDSPERARRLTITIAAGPNHTSRKLSALQVSRPLLYGSLFTGCLAILLNASMTHFKPGGSTPNQRVWTMMWLSVLTANPVLGVFERTWSTRARAGTQSIPGYIAVQLLRLVTSLIAIARVYVCLLSEDSSSSCRCCQSTGPASGYLIAILDTHYSIYPRSFLYAPQTQLTSSELYHPSHSLIHPSTLYLSYVQFPSIP